MSIFYYVDMPAHQDNPDGALPYRPAWLRALGGGLLQHPLAAPRDKSSASQYWWLETEPWQQIQQLSPLLLDMTPCDVSAFVPAAEQTGFNPVALLIMAMAKHPVFVEKVSHLISERNFVDAIGMAWAIRNALGGLEDDSQASTHECMAAMTVALECLGILEKNTAKSGIFLGNTHYTVMRGVPKILKACFEIERSHYFPDVTHASHVPGYLESWVKFLGRLPAALNVGLDTGAVAVTDKLMMWLRSSFPDASPTTVGDAAAWWPVSARLKTMPIHVVALLSPPNVSAHDMQCQLCVS